MSNPRWMTRQFQDLVDLWMPAPVAVGGPGGVLDLAVPSWSLAQSGVKCYAKITPNQDFPTVGGTQRMEFTQFTIDTFYFVPGQVIFSDWVIIYRSLNPDGTHTANYGTKWAVRGAPRLLHDAQVRRYGRLEVRSTYYQENQAGLPDD